MNPLAARARERRLVWMLGFGRSGTTWLLNLMCQLPGVEGVDEPLIGAHLGLSVGASLGGAIQEDRTLYEASRSRKSYFFSDSRRDVWEPALRRLVLAGLTERKPSKALVVIKEPNGSAAAPMIMSVFPSSRLLYVVRDGRDVVDSALDAWSGGWATEQLGTNVGTGDDRLAMLANLARNWVRINSIVQAAYEAHRTDLRLRITYEDLLADTPGLLGRIAAWLGREVPRPQLEAIAERLAFGSIPEDKRGPGKFVRAAQPGLWREHFDAKDREILHETMGSMLAEMGYPPTSP